MLMLFFFQKKTKIKKILKTQEKIGKNSKLRRFFTFFIIYGKKAVILLPNTLMENV